MKKFITVIVALFFANLGIAQQDQVTKTSEEVAKTETITAFYSGNNKGIYYFKNKTDGTLLIFKNVDAALIDKSGLSNREYVGKTFEISYTVEKVEIESKEDVSDDKSVVVKTRVAVLKLKKATLAAETSQK